MVIDVWEPLPIEGFPDYQWCEALGSVRSWRQHRLQPARTKPTVLGGGFSSRGYRMWMLRDSNNKPRSVYLHELVCTKYHGARPCGMEVCHNDGDRNNNAPSNLRWDTHKENCIDRIRHGTSRRGSDNGMAKLSEDQAVQVLECTHITGVALAKMFGVSRSAVSLIRKKRQWKHLQRKVNGRDADYYYECQSC